MTDTVWVALIAMFSASLSSPVLVAWWQHRSTVQVADQAARAAQLLIESNQRIAEQARITGLSTMTRLDEIHTLVNSNMTAAQERELAATRAMLVSMREVISLKEDRGIPVSDETNVIIAEVEKRIKEMANDLRYKKQQTDLANLQRQRDTEAQ
jgi:hypothetical protein